MKVTENNMISVEMTQAELEDLILQHIYRKHADLNGPKWDLEDFNIDWKLQEADKPAVFVMFMRANEVHGVYRDSKCAGNCGACSNSVCR